MKSIYAGLFAVSIALATLPAQAQTKFSAPTPKIAIVDVQKIMREAKSAQAAREQMSAIAHKEQASFADEEKSLRAKDKELQQQRSLLTAEVYAQRQRALQAEVGRLQRKSRDLRLALDQGYKRTMDQIQLVLFDEVRKLTEEYDLNLVIPRSQIVIAVDDYDITKEALERLDKRLPTVSLHLQSREKGSEAK